MTTPFRSTSGFETVEPNHVAILRTIAVSQEEEACRCAGVARSSAHLLLSGPDLRYRPYAFLQDILRYEPLERLRPS